MDGARLLKEDKQDDFVSTVQVGRRLRKFTKSGRRMTKDDHEYVTSNS